MKKNTRITVFVAICLIYILLFLMGCTKTIYVPVESTKIEYRDKFFRDSIHMYDSVFIKEKGDSVRIEKYKYLYRDKIVKDSIFYYKSIQIPYPVVVVKEVNRLKNWQIILMCIGSGAIVYFGFIIIRKFI